MNYKILIALGYLLLISSVLSNMKKAYFRPESLADQFIGTIYLRIAWNDNINSTKDTKQVRCAFACLKEDSCSCFYIESGACVLCLTSNTEAIEGELVTPVATKIVKTKCKFFHFSIYKMNVRMIRSN